MPQDSRPDIAAWPAPPVEPTSFLLSVTSASKSTPVTNARLSSGGHCTPVFELSLTSSASSTVQQQQQPQYSLSAYRYRSQYDIQQQHAKSMSPAASSIAAAASAVAAVAAAASSDSAYGRSRVSSPRPLSLTPQPPNHSVASASSMSNFVEDTSKLLAMLKAVAASSPSATFGRESELRQKIQALEETVAEYERQKFNVMGTFSEYRERVAERERKLEAEYSNRIITLSEEVLGAKKDFETRMKSFQALQEQFEREKEQALEKLRQEHQKEIQVLEQRFSESQLLNLEQKYIIEIQRLEEERKNLKTEKERLGETFEMKLKRAQSLYETELTAAKLLYTRELEALREHEEALKEELAARQEEFHDRLQEIQHQARASKDEMNHCKSEVAILEGKLRQKETEVQEISRTLSAARNETNAALKRLNDTNNEVNERNVEYNAQKVELEQKSRLLNVAESARTKLEATIRDLQTEVKALRSRVDFLEMERDNLQGQSDSQTQLHNSQVQALEAVLESVTKEKETTKEHYEKLLEQEREQAEEREYSIKQEFSTKLNELEDQYNTLREHLEHNANVFEPDNVRLWEEIECLRSEKRFLEDEVHGLRSQLTRNQASEFSLEGIMALLKAIDIVKKKVNFYSDQPAGSSASLLLAVKNDGVQDDEDRVLSEEETMRAITAAIDSRPVGTSSEVAAVGLRLTITDVDGNMRVQDDVVDTVNLEDVLQKIKNIESSLDAIVAEKNNACAKVEQLSEENRSLVEKLEHFQAFHRSNLLGKNNMSDNNVAIDELERLQKCLNSYRARIGELEAAAKAAKESYETRLEAQTVAGEERQTATTVELQSKINDYKSRLHAATAELEVLREQMACQATADESHQTQLQARLLEIESLKSEHAHKIQEIEKREALQLEEKIVSLNCEHEHTSELIRQQETELKAQLDTMNSETRKPVSLEEVEIQTDSSFANDANEHRELNMLRKRVEQLVEENKLKEEEMTNLREHATLLKTYEWRDEEVQCEPSAFPSPVTTSPAENAESWEGKPRKDRSQSMLASPEHLTLCQKAAQRFHSMVEQKKNGTPAKCTLRPPSHTIEGIAKSRLYCKERFAAAKEQMEKSLSPCSSYASASSTSATTTTTTTVWTVRNKSPGYYRERSPAAKLRQFDDVAPQQLTAPQHHASPRSLLLPSEAEIRRRLSPTRQLYFNKNVEKRPAWKF